MEFNPIGTFCRESAYKYETPRQGTFFPGHPGKVKLKKGFDFEMALRDIEDFERLWLVFCFHQNKGWRPTTRPPVPPADHSRVGVFASRSPYRPNAIGLSCVRLLKVEGLTLIVDESDLLDGTPILDIKPYIPKADAFPKARTGWVEAQSTECWTVRANPLFKAQNQWLMAHCDFDLYSFAQIQLTESPFDKKRKRIKCLSENTGVFAYRTFRMDFSFDKHCLSISLERIYSGYSLEELASSVDKYGDKMLHRAFLCEFPE